MKKGIYIFSIFLFSTIANGQSGSGTEGDPYYGIISSNVTWTSGRTVYIGIPDATLPYDDNDIRINNGGHLTIESGVTVIFKQPASDLIVTGTGRLSANGSFSSQIIFTRYYPTNTYWGHISFESMGAAGASVIDNCIIEYGHKYTGTSEINSWGGGIYAGFSDLTISHTLIRNNYAGWGGGLFIGINYSPSINNCQIYSNTSVNSGGGVYVYSGSTSFFENCMIYKNISSVGGGGGGLFLGPNCGNLKIINSIIVDNNASSSGMNIHLYDNDLTLPNRPTFINCIIWKPANSIFYTSQTTSSSDFVNCAIQNPISGSTTNCISLNSSNTDPAGPNFVAEDGTDWSINFISLCRDAGTTPDPTVPQDYADNYRIGPYDIGAYENQYSRWTGITDYRWDNSTASNWELNLLPTSTSNVVIPVATQFPAIVADVTVANLILEATASQVHVDNLYSLTVTDKLTNNGTLIVQMQAYASIGTIVNNNYLILESDWGSYPNFNALLISNNPYTGSSNATVQMGLHGGLNGSLARFHYFVPPVQSMTIGSTISDVNTNLGITNFNGDLLRFYEPAAVSSQSEGWQYFDNYPSFGTPNFTSLTPDRGYNIYLTGDDKIKFQGVLNTSQHTFNLPYTSGNVGKGWNLVGNPYTCNYDLKGISGLMTNGDDIGNNVYYNHDGGYTYYNVYMHSGSTGYTDIVPPMQGFFVKVTATGKSITLPVAYKTFSAADARSKGTGEESKSNIKKIKLFLTNGTKTDETLAFLMDDATLDYNGDYDANKLFGNTKPPYIYSTINGTDYFMKALPTPGEKSVAELPIKVALSESGTQTIKITEFENFEGFDVKLKHSSIITPLSLGTVYTFNSVSGTYSDFSLVFSNITTDVESPDFNASDIKFWYSNNFIYMKSFDTGLSGNGILNIYDFNGRKIYGDRHFEVFSGQTTQIPANLSKGFYVTDLSVGNRHYKSKIVVY